eukprot:2033410-Amphidinium_carterae.1
MKDNTPNKTLKQTCVACQTRPGHQDLNPLYTNHPVLLWAAAVGFALAISTEILHRGRPLTIKLRCPSPMAVKSRVLRGYHERCVQELEELSPVCAASSTPN